ncbi:MAG: hypothetical protein D6785_02565 [Planctomycetota bacterium]|nr:MAG: hypothetical protein D6785_02565 [Planctomycetota bacterium]
MLKKQKKITFLFIFLISPSFLFSSHTLQKPFWQAIMQLGYDGSQKKVNPKKAYQNIEEILAFAKDILYRYSLAPETSQFVREIRGRLGSLDIGNLYDLMPYKKEPSLWKGMGIQGNREKTGFQIQLIPPKLDQWILDGEDFFSSPRKEWFPLKQMGEFSLRAFIRPHKVDTFRFQTQAQSHFGGISPSAFLMAFQTFLTNIWEAGTLSVKKENIPEQFRQRHASLSLRGLHILYHFSKSLPHIYQKITQFIIIHKILDPQFSSSKILKIHLVLQPRISSFSKFPHLQKIFENLKGIFQYKMRIYDNQGHLVLLTSGNTFDYRFHIHCLLGKGKLWRVRIPWEPLKNGGIPLFSPTPMDFKSLTDSKIYLQGIQVLIRNFQLALNYRVLPKGVEARIGMTTPPKVFKLKGALFGFVPLWLIDFLIPSNLEKIIHDFLTTMAKGNDGKGFQARMGIYQFSKDKYRFQALGQGEILANGMIRFAFSFQNYSGLANPALLLEVRKFGRLFWHAFLADYIQFRYGD